MAFPQYPALRAELITRASVDSATRRAWLEEGSQDAVRDVSAMDAANTTRMRAILGTYGWPNRFLVGDDGAHAAWLLVQHAPLDLQQQALPSLSNAVEAGGADSSDWAFLVDRVRQRCGQSQLYGTQYLDHGHGLELVPVEDPERLDERRAAVGLCPHAEYDEAMRADYVSPLRNDDDEAPGGT